ncbi:MAG: UDP-N-acetylmuramate--L-alanine ligase [Planctomycetota bacterium]
MKLSHLRKIHFIGIGGAGVSGLARIAIQSGIQVSGSDMVESDFTRELIPLGATIHVGHHRDNVPADASLTVISAAIRPENHEYRESGRLGIRIMKYAEALGEITRSFTNLCIAGTHGKTTTSAMLAQIMLEAKKQPGWLVGGEPVSLPAASAAGRGKHFVMESCEYDRSFMQLFPNVIVLNNIELDHMDVYGDINGLVSGFIDFAKKLPTHGLLIYNADDEHCRKAAAKAGCHAVGFGESKDADWRLCDLDASNGFARGLVKYRGMTVGTMQLEVPGRVNAINALGALAAANWAGVPTRQALQSLQNFRGVKRRFEVLGSIGGVPLVDDYAHHPTAVEQLLRTARRTFKGRNIIAVFQAHQYQRILQFHDEFAENLKLADRVLIARTYAAREKGVIPGEPEDRLARKLRDSGVSAMAYSDFESIRSDIAIKSTPRDVVIFIGAGDVNEIGYDLIRERTFVSARLRALKEAKESHRLKQIISRPDTRAGSERHFNTVAPDTGAA